MKKVISFVAFALVCLLITSCSGNKTKAEKHGWKLAMQSYTFHKFDLMEALNKTQELGIKYIEIYPGHKLGKKWGDQVFDCNMDGATQKELKEIAASKGIKIVGTGVFSTSNPEEWEKEFSFAKAMGIEYITCEPELKDWDLIEKLSKKYDINIAVHNHPKPSTYWDPQNILAVVSKRSKKLGACADVGHWKRCELNQIECLRQLNERIISLHFKDIAKGETMEDQHDVIWGTGVLDVKTMLEVLKEQKFKGYFAIEYEYNWSNSVPDIKQCIDYFNQTASEIL